MITSSKSCHICYCHSPMRYIWDMYPEYRRGMGRLVGPIFSLAAHYMRLWDYASAGRVDYFVANSHFVASRIRKYYRRESTVIHSRWMRLRPRSARSQESITLRSGAWLTTSGLNWRWTLAQCWAGD